MADLTDSYDGAIELMEQGKHEEAIEKLTQLLAEDADYVLAHLALAVLYGKLEKHDEAVQHGQRACELEPDDAFNFTALSVTCVRAFSGTRNPEFMHLAEDAKAKASVIQSKQS